ncbi:MAG: hypothetical protein Aurels2KO_51390 [Aureliella sp.]
MARPLTFQLGEDEVSLQMNKVDRTKLYGSKEQLALDESEQACELATLADDGRTLIGKGGTALGWIDADGKWCDKTALKPINVDGDEVEPVQSSFGRPIKLFETVDVETYLEHNIRLLYTMKADDSDSEGNPAYQQIVDALKAGTIFSFDYSFRGGLVADAAFLLANEDGEIMMAVGTRSNVSMIELQASAATEIEVEDSTSDDDTFSFDMI